ncbi:hypothetical protein H0O02_01800 [Candidatus Micrarchaeota archaeon]|nr:hypothetical protein [Candidatus Micrarchaeota archaeon]
MAEEKKEEKKTEKGVEKPPEKIPEKNESVDAVVKELEKNIFSIKFYPVAVDEHAKDEAVMHVRKAYNEGNETVRQIVLFMLHEAIAEFSEFRTVHNFEYMRMKNPAVEPAQARIEVYKKMFNYNTSIEGVMELVSMLGSLRGGDDSAKVLTYHYARLCTWESEASVLLRNAVITALGESKSPYALNALMEYAKNTDNEKTFGRLLQALEKWDEKLQKAEMAEPKRKKIAKELKAILAMGFKGGHYG